MTERSKVGEEWIRLGEEMLEDIKKRRDILESSIIRMEEGLAKDKTRYNEINKEGPDSKE